MLAYTMISSTPNSFQIDNNIHFVIKLFVKNQSTITRHFEYVIHLQLRTNGSLLVYVTLEAEYVLI